MRDENYRPQLPLLKRQCAAKDAEIEALKHDIRRHMDIANSLADREIKVREWLDQMPARIDALNLDHDRAVAIGGWISDLLRILRGEE